MRTVTRGRQRWILLISQRPGIFKEVNTLPNPLAIGMTLGGLLLDIVAPRPKPRAGIAPESSLLSRRAVSRTPHPVPIEEHESSPVASGRLSVPV
jgi:hypothetical protein